LSRSTSKMVCVVLALALLVLGMMGDGMSAKTFGVQKSVSEFNRTKDTGQQLITTRDKLPPIPKSCRQTRASLRSYMHHRCFILL
jgi:hypothetical protein